MMKSSGRVSELFVREEMVYLLDKENIGFPDPRLADSDGILAVGGGMTTEWLLNAYYMGIFPWYIHHDMPHWYSPDPRMVLFPGEFHCAKSLERVLRSRRFETRVDTCFRDVIESCASVERGDGEQTWITEEFIEAYCELHKDGFAHSFETFLDGRLVGGLYGVSISDYFCGESMFHTVTDASKVAFARMVDFAQLHGFRFVDTQMYTAHLASLGARQLPREDFLHLLETQDLGKTFRGRWKNNTVVLLLGGNQGERVALLMKAISEIAHRIGTVSVASSVYETEPWGFESEQAFLNQALVVDTDLSAHEVLEQALQIEKELGRQRPAGTVGYSSRPMDIDLIFYNNEIVDTPDLQLPHPRMQLRRFVLVPLVQIIPNFRHPKLHKTISSLLADCGDEGEVKLYF